MRLFLCVSATVLTVCVAWTNLPLPQSSRKAAGWAPAKLGAATLNLIEGSDTLDNENEKENILSRLYNDNIMSLLDPVQSSSSDDCLKEMTRIFLSSETHPPGTLSWDVLDTSYSVLHAWSKTNTYVGAQVAHNILKRLLLEQEYSQKQDLVTPKLFGMVVEAYNRADDPRAAEQVLSEMTQAPNRIILNSILNAWARKGNTQEAERIFEQISSPILADYNSLLSAFAKSGNARQAENVLRQMMDDAEIVPNVVSYNCILDSWAKSGEAGAADRAFQILTSLQENADAHSYSSVVNAYIQEGNVQKAQELLQQAESSEYVVMDAHLQNSILMAHALQGNAKLAEEILQEMESEGVATTVSYNTVIKAWKQSGAPDMAQRAEAILERMVARELDDVFSYNTVVSLSCTVCLMNIVCFLSRYRIPHAHQSCLCPFDPWIDWLLYQE